MSNDSPKDVLNYSTYLPPSAVFREAVIFSTGITNKTSLLLSFEFCRLATELLQLNCLSAHEYNFRKENRLDWVTFLKATGILTKFRLIYYDQFTKNLEVTTVSWAG